MSFAGSSAIASAVSSVSLGSATDVLSTTGSTGANDAAPVETKVERSKRLNTLRAAKYRANRRARRQQLVTA